MKKLFTNLASLTVEDLFSSEEGLHVGDQEQDPGVMQSRQLVMQLWVQHLHTQVTVRRVCMLVHDKEQDPGVMQGWQLVMQLCVQHLHTQVTVAGRNTIIWH